MRGLDLPRFSLGEVGQGRGEFFGPPTGVSLLSSRSGPAYQRHWESRKSDSAIHRSESLRLRLPTTRAGKWPRANVDFHKAPLRFVSSNPHFATPMVPACRAD